MIVTGTSVKKGQVRYLIVNLVLSAVNWPLYRDSEADVSSVSPSVRSDEGLTLVGAELIKPNYLVILPPTQHHGFFRNLYPVYLKAIRGK